MISKNISLLLILAILSGVTRFLFFGHPSTIIFDEAYFGKYASTYITGEYHFDSHPPLGKQLIWLAGQIGGMKEDPTDYSTIGNDFDDRARFWYRLLPAIAGTLLPLIIFLLLLSFRVSRGGAFLGGALVILENSLLVQSRFVSLDSMLLLFGFTSLLFYSMYKRTLGRARSTYLVLSAVLSALTFGIKWTGLAFPLTIVLFELLATFDKNTFFSSARVIIRFTAVYAVIGLILYTIIFYFHFAYLTQSGPGNAFMTDRFQKTLQGNQYTDDPDITSQGFLGKYLELNMKMLEINRSMTATHPYSSKWYTWPIMQRSVFYWQGQGESDNNRYLYFLGNPFIYWFGTLSIGFLAWRVIFRKTRQKLGLVILIGFFANFIPYSFIDRVMFAYHYQPALVFSILATCWVFENWAEDKERVSTMTVILLLCLVSFIFFSPLTYGTNLSEEELKTRIRLTEG